MIGVECLSLQGTHKVPMDRPIDEVQQQANRAAYMDFLYKFHQRGEAPPGLRGTYTGLAEQHARWLGEEYMRDEQFRIGQWFMREEIKVWDKYGEPMERGYAEYGKN